jgi:hypothetical protein
MKTLFSFFITILLKTTTSHLTKVNENAQQFRGKYIIPIKNLF